MEVEVTGMGVPEADLVEVEVTETEVTRPDLVEVAVVEEIEPLVVAIQLHALDNLTERRAF